MNNDPFYYFFSATPQVLGAIMGLFSVMIIFRIQSIKSDLISHGTGVVNLINSGIKKRISKSRTNDEILKELEDAIVKKSPSSIASVLSLIDPESGVGSSYHMIRFDVEIDIHKDLIKSVINATLISSSTIGLSLVLIPFGNWFINRPELLSLLFFIVVLGVILSLIYYVYILRICIEREEIRHIVPVRYPKKEPIKTTYLNYIKSHLKWFKHHMRKLFSKQTE